MTTPTTRPPRRAATDAAATLALALALTAAPAVVRANGALPATIQVLLPPAAPATIILATNFGLITSIDGGASWRWTCEHDEGAQGTAYQLAAGPGVRLLALAGNGLVRSDDLACRWSLVVNHDSVVPFDYFPDPASADRVLLLAILRNQQGAYAVVELTFGAAAAAAMRPLYVAPAGEDLKTVEVARMNPRIAYATLSTSGRTSPARIARTEDGGTTWTLATPDPPEAELGILAIDADDPNKLFLRARTDAGDRLDISDDGGRTLRAALAPEGRTMSAFARLPNGHVLVAWLDIDHGYLNRSTDGGATFQALPTALHPRALAERNGRIYAATDFVSDKYVLAASDDEGSSWQPALRFDQVKQTDACAATAGAVCAGSCAMLMMRGVFTPAECTGPVRPADAAVDAPAPTPTADAAADAPLVTPPDAPTITAPAPTSGGGCSCRAAGARGAPGGWPLAALACALAWLRRR